jgi:hypothetical protein
MVPISSVMTMARMTPTPGRVWVSCMVALSLMRSLILASN